VQKLIERVPAERLSFIPAFKGSVFELSTHPYGCRVLQRCFEHLSEEQTRPLMDELHKYIINLMQDQFGVRRMFMPALTGNSFTLQNYVVQYVLEYGKQHDRALVISKLRGQMLHMSRHKFASNVCEKALLTADPESRRVLIQEIMTSKQDGASNIATMMKDQYASKSSLTIP
jgi:pumilio RNA-binding family